MKDKALRLLGLCKRAGKCIAGESMCEKAVQKGEAHLIVLDALTGANTTDRFKRLSETYNVALIRLEGAAATVGSPDKRVIVVLEQGFASRVMIEMQGCE